jgi:hypothetical protein
VRIPTFEVLAGTTLKLTWVNSGATVTAISLSLWDRNEVLVNSVTPTNSGNGHYYAPLLVPTSDSWYVARAVAVVDAATYVNRALVKCYRLEVD